MKQDRQESVAAKVGDALRDANSPQDSPVDSEQKRLLRAAKTATAASQDTAGATDALVAAQQNRGVA